MTNTTAPRIERAMTKIYVPHEKGEIAFASPSYGPNTHQSIGKAILGNGLKVPTGDCTASLLHPAYCNPQFSNEPEFKNVRDLMRTNWLWVFNRNLWTDKGVYVFEDVEAKGRSESLNLSDLEKRLKDSKEINGIRFSKDGRVRFASNGTYKLGEQTPQSLSEDGFVVASYNLDGAKKLGEVSSKFPNKPYTYGIEVAEGNQPELRISALSGYIGRLHVNGNGWSDDGRGRAFGVL